MQVQEIVAHPKEYYLAQAIVAKFTELDITTLPSKAAGLALLSENEYLDNTILITFIGDIKNGVESKSVGAKAIRVINYAMRNNSGIASVETIDELVILTERINELVSKLAVDIDGKTGDEIKYLEAVADKFVSFMKG